MTGFVELGGGAESGRAGTDEGYFFSGAVFRRFGDDPTLVPAFIDDGTFDVLNGDGRSIDAEHTGAFARRRADAAGKIGKIICFVKPFQRFFPQPAINE